MTDEKELHGGWMKWARLGIIKTQIPDGGRVIEIGIRSIGNVPSYYAGELLADGSFRHLQGGIEERVIADTNFVIQWNRYRALKPGNRINLGEGEMAVPPAEIQNCGFRCNNSRGRLSLLVRDSIPVLLNNRRYNSYYNGFPIAKHGHLICVPVERSPGEECVVETLPHYPQQLDKNTIEDFLIAYSDNEASVTFFNSLHAGASVNHLHFQQVFYKNELTDRLAIENAEVEDYHGYRMLANYPINGLVFDSGELNTLWRSVENLQEKSITFNWILIGAKNYLVPRKKKFEKVSEFSDILASYEIAGEIVTTSEQIYSAASREIVYSAFGKMSYTPDELVQLVTPI